ncbi:MAG: hypothetical protein K9M54_03545 [Kiritimatiellales bacterium]|nr:hypothetical protein [Kiritimatiellales bacterium]
MGLFNLFKASKTVLVVDGESLNDALGMKGKIPPRNQLQILRRLARFASCEKIETIVVLSGSPLIKAPAGKKFEDVTVIYSKTMEAHAKFLAKTAMAKGSGTILITGNAAAEKLVGTRVKTMRVSTFRKAFDFGATEGGGEASERNGAGGEHERERERSGGGNRNRPPRRRNQKSSDEKKPDRERERERPPKEMSDADAINELIDLVD